ncbi:hypothetical protein dqs_2776 [Azoarcus olearius]|uniref:DUF4336 domain-containing protein n=1 Tax=Azoarcus sp. (strain BH72) TaxID=418699 RepID=UPI000806092F|nr:DUF4336 domain-containing protein [Azoarcus olearius]ANQ85805.1 hypothetical protein dqs_2776 [Azoarcus olearius]
MASEHAAWNPAAEFELTQLAPDIWIARHPLSFFGFRMTTCMTVVRLPSGGVWLHSPIPLQGGLKAAVDALGPVQFVVAPNRLHHLYALAAMEQYPQARLFVAPGLTDKNPAFAPHPPLPEAAVAPWADSIDAVFVAGNSELNETVFFHRPSRTLVITDLAVFLGSWDAFATRLYARINGCYNRFGHSFLLRRFFRDVPAARRSVQAMLEWPIERIVMAHGPVLRRDARARLREAFAWLL